MGALLSRLYILVSSPASCLTPPWLPLPFSTRKSMSSANVFSCSDRPAAKIISLATPSLRIRLVSCSASLLDATLVDHASRDVVYGLLTDPCKNTTMLTRPDAERVAWVQWATPGTPSSTSSEPTILFQGDMMPISASEMLFSSSVLSQ